MLRPPWTALNRAASVRLYWHLNTSISFPVNIGPKVHILLDHDDEVIAGPNLQCVRDRQTGARIFLPELAELLTERGAAR